jgi:4a-hydroxytetrahydrobiopterin dehydratase
MILENDQVITVLKDTNWHLKGRSIIRAIKYETFFDVANAMHEIAEIAMQLSHDPNIEITDNRLKIILISKEDGGVTITDIDMASKIDKILGA